MKTLWIALLLCATTFVPASAQKPQIKPAEVGVELLRAALEAQKYAFLSFDLSPYLDSTYQVTLYVDIHDSTGVRRLRKHHLGENRYRVADLSPEDKATLTQMGEITDPNQILFRELKQLSISIIPQTDSTARMLLHSPTGGSLSFPITLRPVVTPTYTAYNYDLRSFDPIVANEKGDIPLAFYGSYWFDPKLNLLRMCQAEECTIFESMPHYYQIGIRFDKKAD